MKIIWKMLIQKGPVCGLLVVLLFAAGSYDYGFIQLMNKVEKS
ncbi:hypothetical protein [Streptococcus thoraltensis]